MERSFDDQNGSCVGDLNSVNFLVNSYPYNSRIIYNQGDHV